MKNRTIVAIGFAALMISGQSLTAAGRTFDSLGSEPQSVQQQQAMERLRPQQEHQREQEQERLRDQQQERQHEQEQERLRDQQRPKPEPENRSEYLPHN